MGIFIRPDVKLVIFLIRAASTVGSMGFLNARIAMTAIAINVITGGSLIKNIFYVQAQSDVKGSMLVTAALTATVADMYFVLHYP